MSSPDLIAYSKQKREIAALFEERGYVLDPSIRASTPVPGTPGLPSRSCFRGLVTPC